MTSMDGFVFVRTIVVAFGVAGAMARPAYVQAAPSANPDDPRAEQQVREASTAEVKAFIHKDANRLASLWSDDMVVTNPLNKFVTKQQVLGMVRAGVLTFSAYDRHIGYAHAYGDTVIMAGSEIVTWGNRMPHGGKTERLLFTAVWMKQGGRWQEVARHANVVPSAPG